VNSIRKNFEDANGVIRSRKLNNAMVNR